MNIIDDILLPGLDFYLIFILVAFFITLLLNNKRMLTGVFMGLVALVIYLIADLLGLTASVKLYEYVLAYVPIALIVIYAPDVRKHFERLGSKEVRNLEVKSHENVRESVVAACQFLSSKKFGAIITLEKNTSLDIYANKAIRMDSLVSKELLIAIFTPNNNPLHDGAVIIRGNKIRCASAFYEIAEGEDIENTLGSRHRAALGISEVSDSLTIIVSEETGGISIASEGILVKMRSLDNLKDYIRTFVK